MKPALERNRVDREDVRQMPETALAAMGVRLVNKQNFVLECTRCGEHWSPPLNADGKLPHDAFTCPAGCNR